jgi:hypothetical protein
MERTAIKKERPLPIRGVVVAVVKNEQGVVQQVEVGNLVVDVGKNQIADNLLASPTLGTPTHMALGTSNTAPAAGQTALVAEIAPRNALTSKTRSANVVTMVANWAAGEATNSNINEAGLFSAAASGNMTARAIFGSAVNKGAGDTLQVTWTITIG